MAVKTFTTGEVLTAADTNTYLNNGGLVYIKSQTIGSGVSSVAVSSAFSSDYDIYFVTVSGGAASTATDLKLQLGSTTSGYYGSRIGNTYASDTVIVTRDNNAAAFTNIGSASTSDINVTITISGPNMAKPTHITGFQSLASTVGGSFTYNGYEASSTQHTAFTIITNTGTLTGGNIRVYGYRQA